MKGTPQGKSFNDRVLAGEVRTLTLEEIKRVLLGEDNDFKKQVVLKLAGTVLPRLNELTGEDGGNIKIEGVEITVRK